MLTPKAISSKSILHRLDCMRAQEAGLIVPVFGFGSEYKSAPVMKTKESKK